MVIMRYKKSSIKCAVYHANLMLHHNFSKLQKRIVIRVRKIDLEIRTRGYNKNKKTTVDGNIKQDKRYGKGRRGQV